MTEQKFSVPYHNLVMWLIYEKYMTNSKLTSCYLGWSPNILDWHVTYLVSLMTNKWQGFDYWQGLYCQLAWLNWSVVSHMTNVWQIPGQPHFWVYIENIDNKALVMTNLWQNTDKRTLMWFACDKHNWQIICQLTRINLFELGIITFLGTISLELVRC